MYLNLPEIVFERFVIERGSAASDKSEYDDA